MRNEYIFFEDLENIISAKRKELAYLDGKTVLVTGATGLIGKMVVSSLLYYNEKENGHINIIIVVRNSEKAISEFSKFDISRLKIIVSDINDKLICSENIDYIIHAASNTSSKDFVSKPVDVIMTALRGTENVLNLAVEKKVCSFVFLSTMEVYGMPTDDCKIDENFHTNLNTMNVRSSYPESKRMCEQLCVAYMNQYGVPVKVMRLTQTFGPGVDYNDKRVFAEFARSVIEDKNIVLHTRGETKRNYLYISDAVTAIFTVLINGKNGEAYNAANESTYCSIYEMAQMVAMECSRNKIAVEICIEDESKYGYAPELCMNLSTDKLKSLGWIPERSLCEMYERLCLTM